MDPSQKSETLKKRPKIKNYNVKFHTRSAVNKFTKNLLKIFTRLHFFTEKKTF